MQIILQIEKYDSVDDIKREKAIIDAVLDTHLAYRQACIESMYKPIEIERAAIFNTAPVEAQPEESAKKPVLAKAKAAAKKPTQVKVEEPANDVVAADPLYSDFTTFLRWSSTLVMNGQLTQIKVQECVEKVGLKNTYELRANAAKWRECVDLIKKELPNGA